MASNGEASLSFTPSLPANAFFLICFALLFALHVGLAMLFWRWYGYLIGIVAGLLLELLGYVAKVQLSHNRGNKSAYIMYIIGLTLGPTFLSSSLYLSVSALQQHFHIRCFGSVGPRMFATLFILGDFLCLCFIGVGGSLAAIFADQPIGVDLMIAGLGVQVLFTTVFVIVLQRVHVVARSQLSRDHTRWYMFGTLLAALCLFVRSCWRAAELSGGFNGPLASKESIFIALDSVPMLVMSVILSALHPRVWFANTKRSAEKLGEVSGGGGSTV